jgi:hypothetical protein
MRFLVEFRSSTDEGVTGTVLADSDTQARPFTGWLDLIQHLEPAASFSENEDIAALADLNRRIGQAESDGDVPLLAGIVSPVLAFRRASGAYVDRQQFLDSVRRSPHRTTRITNVDLSPPNSAVVRCAVTLEEPERATFDNVRLFVRSADSSWRLLGWINTRVELGTTGKQGTI